MGWAVLYIAFGCVALWLLGEVLLQYKARLRWRLLAFCGFLCVVLGVLMASIPVIFVGAMAFGAGQLFVTLSFRRGFSTGWAIGGKPGSSRRRRSEEPTSTPPPVVDREPVLEVSPLEDTTTYQPQPLPDDTGQYGVYQRDEDLTTSFADQDYTGGYGHDPAATGTGEYDELSHGHSGYAPADATSDYGSPGYGDPSHGTPAYGTYSYEDSDTLGGYEVPAYGAADQGDHGPQDTYGSPLYSAAPAQPYGYGGEQYDTYGGGSYQGSPYGDPAYPDSSYSSGTYPSDSYSAASYGQQGQHAQPDQSGYLGYPGANDLYDPLSGAYQGDTGGYPTTSYPADAYGATAASTGHDPAGYTDPYAPPTPPDGVWVPQQREAGSPPHPHEGDYGYYEPRHP